MTKTTYTFASVVSVIIVMGTMLVSTTSCADHNFDFEEHYYGTVEQMYEKEFRDQFGAIDPTHDWSTGTVVNANVDLSAWVSGEATVRVMSSMPICDDCVMLYKGSISGATSVSFDAPKHLSHVYVTAEQNGEYVFGQYFEIKNEVCNIGESGTRGVNTEHCPTTINTSKKYDLKKGDNKIATEFYLNDIQSGDGTQMKLKDLAKIVGSTDGAYFKERINNREKFDEVFSHDVIYNVAADGPVSLTYQFGGAAYYNQFGYFYYFEGDTEDATKRNKRSANRYVIMPDARPHFNIKVGDKYIKDYANHNSGTDLPNHWIASYEGNNNNVTGDEIVTGTKYRLVYFDENGNASYNFPKDIKIGFYIHTVTHGSTETTDIENGEATISTIRYSDTYLNDYYFSAKYTYKENDNPKKGQQVPYWAAVTCRIGDKIICGFEDNYGGDTDNDMNDVLFVVEGVNPEDIPDIPVDEPELNECLIAYEDMGSVGDFDFNDVVISVSARDEAGFSTVKLLAAGGTLDTKVLYKGASASEDIELKFYSSAANVQTSTTTTTGTEVHTAFGVGQNVMVNTGLAGPTPYGLVPTARIAVPEGWTVGANKQRFAIKVLKAEGEDPYKTINIPYTSGEVPQAFLIADMNWEWPYEREPIYKRYPAFPSWVENNLANNFWYFKAWGEDDDVEVNNGQPSSEESIVEPLSFSVPNACIYVTTVQSAISSITGNTVELTYKYKLPANYAKDAVALDGESDLYYQSGSDITNWDNKIPIISKKHSRDDETGYIFSTLTVSKELLQNIDASQTGVLIARIYNATEFAGVTIQ